ncbi:hypothetical protein [Micromonospora carbonacea]|uniref:hypothetical protein n=1 Tax=Micromonospora carbonacea TaxID=47853 RepID=UPI001FE49316|nr:hypothetical protein [Micromonospora carbonacea]
MGLLVAGDLDVPGRVAVQDAFLDREVEGGPQGGAQMVHRRGGLRTALAVSRRRYLREHGAQERGVEVGQTVAAELRDEDVLDVSGVVKAGGGPDLRAVVEPVPQPPLDRPALCRPVRLRGGQPFVASVAGGGLRGVAATADPLAAAE